MRVLLVNMPCSSIRPPLGVGLLKSLLSRDGFDATVFNANIAFADRLGVRFYHYLSELAPIESLAGEFLFARCLNPEIPREPYLAFLGSRFPLECPPEARDQLERAGSHVEGFLTECVTRIVDGDYTVVGFTSSFAQNMASLALAQRLKQVRPETVIAFGGANCEDRMGLGLHRAFSFVDLVFCGEADISFPQAIRALSRGESLADIRGLVHREPLDGSSAFVDLSPQRIRNLDDLPYPDYDDFFREYASLPCGSRTAGVPMETSRGCWWGEKHHCTFCGLNGLSMAFRAKSPERALAELAHLQHRYDVSDIQMVDNILAMDYMKTVLPALARATSKPALFYETKANLTREHLALFRSAGISAIQPGIESLDTRVLRLMDKGTTGIRSVELLKSCREIGIWPHWNILYGFPDEPPDAYELMATRVEWLTHLDAPNVCTRLRLDRFSPLYMRAEEFGITDVRPAQAYSLLYDLPPDTVREIAYYFDFSYRDGRCPDAYAEPLRTAVAEWQASRGGDLTVEQGSNAVTIVDTRGKRRREVVLEDLPAQIYVSCLTSKTARSLEERFQVPPRSQCISSLLEQWVAEKIMLELDGRYLSLAIDATVARLSRRRRKPSWSQVLRAALADEARGATSSRGLFSDPRTHAAGLA
jgi:ribosomal peptide maturation radical SAM protein 1